MTFPLSECSRLLQIKPFLRKAQDCSSEKSKTMSIIKSDIDDRIVELFLYGTFNHSSECLQKANELCFAARRISIDEYPDLNIIDLTHFDPYWILSGYEYYHQLREKKFHSATEKYINNKVKFNQLQRKIKALVDHFFYYEKPNTFIVSMYHAVRICHSVSMKLVNKSKKEVEHHPSDIYQRTLHRFSNRIKKKPISFLTPFDDFFLRKIPAKYPDLLNIFSDRSLDSLYEKDIFLLAASYFSLFNEEFKEEINKNFGKNACSNFLTVIRDVLNIEDVYCGNKNARLTYAIETASILKHFNLKKYNDIRRHSICSIEEIYKDKIDYLKKKRMEFYHQCKNLQNSNRQKKEGSETDIQDLSEEEVSDLVSWGLGSMSEEKMSVIFDSETVKGSKIEKPVPILSLEKKYASQRYLEQYCSETPKTTESARLQRTLLSQKKRDLIVKDLRNEFYKYFRELSEYRREGKLYTLSVKWSDGENKLEKHYHLAFDSHAKDIKRSFFTCEKKIRTLTIPDSWNALTKKDQLLQFLKKEVKHLADMKISNTKLSVKQECLTNIKNFYLKISHYFIEGLLFCVKDSHRKIFFKNCISIAEGLYADENYHLFHSLSSVIAENTSINRIESLSNILSEYRKTRKSETFCIFDIFDGKHSMYRELLHKASSSAIPYIGFYLRDLQLCSDSEGNQKDHENIKIALNVDQDLFSFYDDSHIFMFKSQSNILQEIDSFTAPKIVGGQCEKYLTSEEIYELSCEIQPLRDVKFTSVDPLEKFLFIGANEAFLHSVLDDLNSKLLQLYQPLISHNKSELDFVNNIEKDGKKLTRFYHTIAHFCIKLVNESITRGTIDYTLQNLLSFANLSFKIKNYFIYFAVMKGLEDFRGRIYQDEEWKKIFSYYEDFIEKGSQTIFNKTCKKGKAVPFPAFLPSFPPSYSVESSFNVKQYRKFVRFVEAYLKTHEVKSYEGKTKILATLEKLEIETKKFKKKKTEILDFLPHTNQIKIVRVRKGRPKTFSQIYLGKADKPDQMKNLHNLKFVSLI